MKLIRKEFRDDGIFGELVNSRNDLIAVTLEHAYQYGDGYAAKVPPGNYICKRRHSNKFDCEVFEITNVPGATDILFHIGNYNDESDGCVLLGLQIGNKSNGGKMIMNSKVAFDRFMERLDGVETFPLEVI